MKRTLPRHLSCAHPAVRAATGMAICRCFLWAACGLPAELGVICTLIRSLPQARTSVSGHASSAPWRWGFAPHRNGTPLRHLQKDNWLALCPGGARPPAPPWQTKVPPTQTRPCSGRKLERSFETAWELQHLHIAGHHGLNLRRPGAGNPASPVGCSEVAGRWQAAGRIGSNSVSPPIAPLPLILEADRIGSFRLHQCPCTGYFIRQQNGPRFACRPCHDMASRGFSPPTKGPPAKPSPRLNETLCRRCTRSCSTICFCFSPRNQHVQCGCGRSADLAPVTRSLGVAAAGFLACLPPILERLENARARRSAPPAGDGPRGCRKWPTTARRHQPAEVHAFWLHNSAARTWIGRATAGPLCLFAQGDHWFPGANCRCARSRRFWKAQLLAVAAATSPLGPSRFQKPPAPPDAAVGGSPSPLLATATDESPKTILGLPLCVGQRTPSATWPDAHRPGLAWPGRGQGAGAPRRGRHATKPMGGRSAPPARRPPQWCSAPAPGFADRPGSHLAPIQRGVASGSQARGTRYSATHWRRRHRPGQAQGRGRPGNQGSWPVVSARSQAHHDPLAQTRLWAHAVRLPLCGPPESTRVTWAWGRAHRPGLVLENRRCCRHRISAECRWAVAAAAACQGQRLS